MGAVDATTLTKLLSLTEKDQAFIVGLIELRASRMPAKPKSGHLQLVVASCAAVAHQLFRG